MVSSFAVLKYIYLVSTSATLISHLEGKEAEQLKVTILSTLRKGMTGCLSRSELDQEL